MLKLLCGTHKKEGEKKPNFEMNLRKQCSKRVGHYIPFYKIKSISTCRCGVMV